MQIKRVTQHGQTVLLGLLAWVATGFAARAQVGPPAHPRPSSLAMRPATAATLPSGRPNPSSHIGGSLQEIYTQAATLGRGPQATERLKAAHPQLRLSKDGAAVLVRITASDVATLLPSLQSRGFVTVAARPDLHFVEGMLPLSQLAPGAAGLEALTTQGLLGVLPMHRPRTRGGLVTSQADYVLEAARARATLPKSLTGAGVRIGIISDSFNSLKGAANDVASGDLPAAGVQILQDLGDGEATDEGRAMAQLIYDLAPGSPLAFSTAYISEADFAQQIVNLANPAKGNCKVIVDDIGYLDEPYFQDGVVARAVNRVVGKGVTYFSAAGNEATNSYENAAPAFITDAKGVARLNFNNVGGTDVTQRFNITNYSDAEANEVQLILQWSDPFYTKSGVKTDLDAYLISAKGDTVARSADSNLKTQAPIEGIFYTNDTTKTHTTQFDLVIVRRSGTANPTRIKYINNLNGADITTAGAVEWLTNSGTVVGHPAAALAMAVGAAPYFDQRIIEDFSSQGNATLLFDTTGVALAAPVTRLKPNFTSIDGTDNTFFGSDAEGNGYPNFFGTSAAAPHAAAVAALLRQSEPALTPAQVYARLTSTARDIGASGVDVATGAGLIDAFTAIYGAPVAVAPPAVEDLEKKALPTSWSVNSTRAGRVQVISTLGPASGIEHLLLDAAVRYTAATATQSLNEATWYLNNASAGSLLLTFRQHKFVAETDEQMPTSFTGSSNSDGVALSVDGGTTWYRVFDLTGTNATTTYQTNSVNLTQFAQANKLTLGSDVRLKFQQYGGGAATGSNATTRRGRVFDDIAITSVSPAPVPLYTSSLPTTGCPGLNVAFSDSSLFKPTSYAWTFAGGTPATSTSRNPTVVYNTAGRFAVTLAVTNAYGTATRVDTGYVVVYGRAPQVTASASRTRICPGGTVSFTSQTAYCPSTYAWSFPGGTPAAATTATATVTYATAGTYAATLTVTNSYGSTSSAVSIEVTSGRTLPFAETFDGSTSQPSGWTIENPDGKFTWSLVTGIVGRAGTTTNAERTAFYADPVLKQRDVLQSPPISLSTAQPTLLFDLAYAPVDASYQDSLLVQVMDACTLTVLGKPYAKGATGGLGTTTLTGSAAFVPTLRTQWRQESVDLSPYVGKSILLRFISSNGNGDYLYLDNVQVGSQLLATTAATSVAGMSAWPNPAAAGTTVQVHLPAQSGGGQLRLVDVLGRTVWQTQVSAAASANDQTLTAPLSSGLYNVIYTPATGATAARRIIIE